MQDLMLTSIVESGSDGCQQAHNLGCPGDFACASGGIKIVGKRWAFHVVHNDISFVPIL
jgi:hypothetical protein